MNFSNDVLLVVLSFCDLETVNSLVRKGILKAISTNAVMIYKGAVKMLFINIHTKLCTSLLSLKDHGLVQLLNFHSSVFQDLLTEVEHNYSRDELTDIDRLQEAIVSFKNETAYKFQEAKDIIISKALSRYKHQDTTIMYIDMENYFNLHNFMKYPHNSQSALSTGTSNLLSETAKKWFKVFALPKHIGRALFMTSKSLQSLFDTKQQEKVANIYNLSISPPNNLCKQIYDSSNDGSNSNAKFFTQLSTCGYYVAAACQLGDGLDFISVIDITSQESICTIFPTQFFQSERNCKYYCKITNIQLGYDWKNCMDESKISKGKDVAVLFLIVSGIFISKSVTPNQTYPFLHKYKIKREICRDIYDFISVESNVKSHNNNSINTKYKSEYYHITFPTSKIDLQTTPSSTNVVLLQSFLELPHKITTQFPLPTIKLCNNIHIKHFDYDIQNNVLVAITNNSSIMIITEIVSRVDGHLNTKKSNNNNDNETYKNLVIVELQTDETKSLDISKVVPCYQITPVVHKIYKFAKRQGHYVPESVKIVPIMTSNHEFVFELRILRGRDDTTTQGLYCLDCYQIKLPRSNKHTNTEIHKAITVRSLPRSYAHEYSTYYDEDPQQSKPLETGCTFSPSGRYLCYNIDTTQHNNNVSQIRFWDTVSILKGADEEKQYVNNRVCDYTKLAAIGEYTRGHIDVLREQLHILRLTTDSSVFCSELQEKNITGTVLSTLFHPDLRMCQVLAITLENIFILGLSDKSLMVIVL